MDEAPTGLGRKDGQRGRPWTRGAPSHVNRREGGKHESIAPSRPKEATRLRRLAPSRTKHLWDRATSRLVPQSHLARKACFLCIQTGRARGGRLELTTQRSPSPPAVLHLVHHPSGPWFFTPHPPLPPLLRRDAQPICCGFLPRFAPTSTPVAAPRPPSRAWPIVYSRQNCASFDG